MKAMKMNWRPLTEMPQNIPSVSHIIDKAFLEEYNGRVKSDFDNAPALQVLNYGNNVVCGSNPFAVTLVNSIVVPLGYRTANQADLEKALSLKAIPLEGNYEDTALVLRSEGNPNSYLAKNLAAQVKKRGYELNKNKPLVIPLSGLGLVKDSNSEHGLSFKLTEKSQIYAAPILSSANGSYIDSSKMDKNTGLPIEVYDKAVAGNRQLWTRDSGLSRLYLNGFLNISSDFGSLACSDDVGLVVLF